MSLIDLVSLQQRTGIRAVPHSSGLPQLVTAAHPSLLTSSKRKTNTGNYSIHEISSSSLFFIFFQFVI